MEFHEIVLRNGERFQGHRSSRSTSGVGIGVPSSTSVIDSSRVLSLTRLREVPGGIWSTRIRPRGRRETSRALKQVRQDGDSIGDLRRAVVVEVARVLTGQLRTAAKESIEEDDSIRDVHRIVAIGVAPLEAGRALADATLPPRRDSWSLQYLDPFAEIARARGLARIIFRLPQIDPMHSADARHSHRWIEQNPIPHAEIVVQRVVDEAPVIIGLLPRPTDSTNDAKQPTSPIDALQLAPLLSDGPEFAWLHPCFVIRRNVEITSWTRRFASPRRSRTRRGSGS